MIQNILQKKYESHLNPSEQISLRLIKDHEGFWLKALLGSPQRAHEFMLVSKENTHELLIEFLDGVLEDFFKADRNAYLPLDFSERVFDNKTLWVKQEFRDFEAEELAKKWLELS